LEFCERCGGSVIYKTMIPGEAPVAPDVKSALGPDFGMGVLATLLTTEKLKEFAPAIRTAPCLFQERIEKQVELRVNVIGEEFFVAEIHSQTREETKVDWRHYDYPVPMRKGSLPREVEDRCLSMVRGHGLTFSAMDFILTPDGRYVFLENNPNGQWFFCQAAVPELKMVEAISHCLADGRPNSPMIAAENASRPVGAPLLR
jgi:glutathione synthase/RimK-type ligase-like ATP-grasp enzyme